MKQLTTIIFLFLLTGCSSANAANTTIFFSGDFKLILPSTMFADATIFTANPRSISLKIGGDAFFSGQVVDNDFEKLPSDFDIREYPKHILNIDTEDKLSLDQEDSFERSWKALDSQYGLENLSIKKIGDVTIYSLCSNVDCLAFIVKDSLKDHILSVYSGGIKATEFKKLVEEYLHVEQ